MATTPRTLTNPGFAPMDPSESVPVGFDFSALTDTPSAPVVTAARHAGAADDSPSAILDGSPTIDGSTVVQRITGGTAGTDYLLRCQVDAPDGSRYVLAGVLPVRTA